MRISRILTVLRIVKMKKENIEFVRAVSSVCLPVWKAGTLPVELLPLDIKEFPVSMVGVRGLEPPTSASQTLRASHLRHTP